MVTDPLVYLNRKIQEFSETRISPFDRGFLWGDGVYEITPCFGGKPFRLNDHIERLYRSLRYVRIDPGLPPKELTAETQRYLDTNQNRLNESVVYRLGHWITRGEDASSMKAVAATPPDYHDVYAPGRRKVHCTKLSGWRSPFCFNDSA